MVRAFAKALDLLVSFVIGFVSDKTRTAFGRRLPFIAVGSIFAPVAMWYLAAPPAEWNLSDLAQGRRLAEFDLPAAGSNARDLFMVPRFEPFAEVRYSAQMLRRRADPTAPHVYARLCVAVVRRWRRFASERPQLRRSVTVPRSGNVCRGLSLSRGCPLGRNRQLLCYAARRSLPPPPPQQHRPASRWRCGFCSSLSFGTRLAIRS